MSEEGAKIKTHWLKKPVGLRCAVFFALGISVIIFSIMVGGFLIETLIQLTIGWLFFLGKNLVSLKWNFEMLACGLVALVLAIYGLHRLLVWIWKRSAWKVSWTISISALMLTLFGASIAMTGIIHQFGWIVREPFTESNRRTEYTTNVHYLKQHFYLLIEYDADYGEFPTNLEVLCKEGYVKDDALKNLGFYTGRRSPKEPWIYLGVGQSVLNEKQDSMLPLMISPRPIKKGWMVLKHDGAAAALPTDKLMQEYPDLIALLPNLIYYE